MDDLLRPSQLIEGNYYLAIKLKDRVTTQVRTRLESKKLKKLESGYEYYVLYFKGRIWPYELTDNDDIRFEESP